MDDSGDPILEELRKAREEFERLKAEDKSEKIQMTTSTAVLEHIEPLLLALSILTIPVTGILASLFKIDGNGK